jgi:hypothetical protein
MLGGDPQNQLPFNQSRRSYRNPKMERTMAKPIMAAVILVLLPLASIGVLAGLLNDRPSVYASSPSAPAITWTISGAI